LAPSASEGWRRLPDGGWTGGGHLDPRQIAVGDITGELARRSGFEGVVDLLKVAKHGSGRNVYLIEFEYCESQ
jgi:hypothetical protein